MQISTPVVLSNSKRVYIVNEGNFGSGNSSISVFDASTNNVVDDIYFSQNNSHIGDVAQSLNLINGNFYIVVNNSNKITICNQNFQKTGQISGLTSPRYIQKITNQRAYVTDLKSNKICIVDLNQNIIAGYVSCPGSTERMAMIYNKVFVCNTKRNYLYQINTSTNLIEDSVFVGINASSLVIDKNDVLWVLSSGDASTNTLARLTKINTINNKVYSFFEFTSSSFNPDLCLNKTLDTLYFLNGGIFRMNISDTQLPSNPLVSKGSRNFYGLGINPNDFTIYASDVLDYVQKSNVYVFDVNGNQKNLFKAGYITNGFYFE